jgi:hypothetical protein
MKRVAGIVVVGIAIAALATWLTLNGGSTSNANEFVLIDNLQVVGR